MDFVQLQLNEILSQFGKSVFFGEPNPCNEEMMKVKPYKI
jgi:hypothetical protein